MHAQNLTLQSLPPAEARFVLAIEQHFLSLGLTKKRLLLALSGGSDSTALAYLAALLRPRLSLTLNALFCDHGLRNEAKAEQEGTRALCSVLAIPLTCVTLPVRERAKSTGEGLEEAGRHERYKALEDERQAVAADAIVTAHHADDLAEDILMRLCRGTGWPGLGGMPRRDDTRHLVRPLLHVDKARLQSFLQSLGAHWFEDASNKDTRFTRNRFRITILPLLKKENPSLLDTFIHLATEAEEDQAFWEDYLAKTLAAHPLRWEEGKGEESRKEEIDEGQKTQTLGEGILLPEELLASLPKAARLRLYPKVVAMLSEKKNPHLSARQLFALDAAYCTEGGKGKKVFSFAGGLEAQIQASGIRFSLTTQPHTSARRKKRRSDVAKAKEGDTNSRAKK